MKYVWFDLGYTLVHVKREENYQMKLKSVGVHKSIEELKLAYHLADKYFMREHPGLLGEKREMYAEAYHKVLHEYLTLPVDHDLDTLLVVEDASKPKGHWEVFEETLTTLASLKEKGIGVGLISNWNDTARAVLEETGILPYLDHIVISSEIQIEKPDERIFQYAFEMAGVLPEECLYVGDNYYDDVVGSNRVGMKSVLINPFDVQGIEELTGVLEVPVISNINELLPIIESSQVVV